MALFLSAFQLCRLASLFRNNERPTLVSVAQGQGPLLPPSTFVLQSLTRIGLSLPVFPPTGPPRGGGVWRALVLGKPSGQHLPRLPRGGSMLLGLGVVPVSPCHCSIPVVFGLTTSVGLLFFLPSSLCLRIARQTLVSVALGRGPILS